MTRIDPFRPPKTFDCPECGMLTAQPEARFDAEFRLVCPDCYLDNVPQCDVDLALEEIEFSLRTA